MKKIVSLLLIISITVCFIGCKTRAENYEVPAVFYYVQSEDYLDLSESVICSETREIAHLEGNLADILNAYFIGPVTEQYRSPFPFKLSAISAIQEDDRVLLTLSDELKELESLEFSIAVSCISMTVFELTNCSVVELQVENALINGKNALIISRDLLYLSDGSHDDLILS